MPRTKAMVSNSEAKKADSEKTTFYLVKEDILPEAIKKTIKAKEKQNLCIYNMRCG